MDFGLLLLLFLLGLFGIFHGLTRPENMLAFPFIFGSALTVYLCPQIGICLMRPELIPEDTAKWMLLYSCAATAVAYAGFFSFRDPMRRYRVSVVPSRLSTVGSAVILAGIIGEVLLLRLLAQYEAQGVKTIVWQGWPVYLYTLTRLILPGIALVWISILIKRTPLSVILLIVGLAGASYMAFVAGRRSYIFWVPFVMVGPYFVVRQIKPNRLLGAMAVLAAPFIFLLVPAYRNAFRGDFENLRTAIADRPPSEVFERYVSGQQTLEAVDSILIFGAYLKCGEYGWGRGFYNSLVQSYVPSNLIGKEFKQSLFLETPAPAQLVLRAYGGRFKTRYYLATSGFSDSFAEFSFFGLILYFVLGRIFAITHAGMRGQRDFRAVIFFMLFGLLPAQLVYGQWTFFFGTSMIAAAIYWFISRNCMRRIPYDASKSTEVSTARVKKRRPRVVRPAPTNPPTTQRNPDADDSASWVVSQ
jgi:hypothetical protein